MIYMHFLQIIYTFNYKLNFIKKIKCQNFISDQHGYIYNCCMNKNSISYHNKMSMFKITAILKW